MIFWDSSALVPLVVSERRSHGMRSIFESDPEPVIWWASPVEVMSALTRRMREGAFGLADLRRCADLVTKLGSAAAHVLPSDEVRSRAIRLLALHPLRAADGLQLAAALTWCSEKPAGERFVCLDDRLRTAAALEGFSVLPG